MQCHPPEMAQAAAYYQQALAQAAALGMRPLQAHCHRGLGTLYAQAGQAEQAHGELSTAREMYRAMAMTCWLPQSEAARNQPTQHGHTGSMRKRLSGSNVQALLMASATLCSLV